jgi:hypothetical protein
MDQLEFLRIVLEAEQSGLEQSTVSALIIIKHDNVCLCTEQKRNKNKMKIFTTLTGEMFTLFILKRY